MFDSRRLEHPYKGLARLVAAYCAQLLPHDDNLQSLLFERCFSSSGGDSSERVPPAVAALLVSCARSDTSRFLARLETYMCYRGDGRDGRVALRALRLFVQVRIVILFVRVTH